MNKKSIKDFRLGELEKTACDMGEPPYRARQIFSWVYGKCARSFDSMKTLPKGLIDNLEGSYYIYEIVPEKRLRSRDGTEKFLFRLADGNFIESVLIFAEGRRTLCLSTQVGCKFACPFCASGRPGFVRNLTPSEMIEQVLFLKCRIKCNISNYVFMGMGEPLDNYENVVKAVFIMNEKEGLAIGARRITISTCGIIPAIDRLAGLGLQINLSLSLHAADDRLRNELVPVNRKYPLEDLIRAGERYIEKAGRTITLEYVLIKGRNHSPEDAERLAAISKRLKAKVNLIECSAVPGSGLGPPAREDTDRFKKRLLSKKIKVTLRRSKGADIRAACGQLAGEKG